MPKERVVVFNGEDKFITPRNVTYNVHSGEANVVGDNSAAPMQPDVSSGAKKEFDDYMRRQGQAAVMPSPVEPDFCLRIRQFIQSNGDGLATSEQVMEAYNLFQSNCVEKPKDERIIAPATPKEEIKDDTQIAPPSPPPSPAPPPPPPTPTATPIMPIAPAISLNTPSLGARPSGGASGGGQEEKEKKKPNWLLLLLLAAGAVYLITNKKN